VSTAKVSDPERVFMTTFAVFRPTPEARISKVAIGGTRPSN
jgi:hypothetical protein